MALVWVLGAALAAAGSGLPALVLGAQSAAGRYAGAALMVGAAAAGLFGAGLSLATGTPAALSWSWSVPGGSFAVALDAISAWFLLPVCLVPALGSLYGLQYWRPASGAGGSRLPLFYGLLAAGMMLLLVARNSVLFLVGWELMALAAFFLVAADDREPETRQAAWVYFVATHIGTVALMALFALLRQATGSFDWSPVALGSGAPGAGGSWPATLMLLLGLLGFGLKAGIMPLHVWLPSAHASAPSHVSAVMSGVMIKMGVYGLVRLVTLLPAPPLWWGALLMALGAASSVIAAASAVAQLDLKRMLAYSSIENVGLITMGLGLALAGRALHQGAWVALGLGGALLHVLNHSLFKSLLFLGAGSLLHGTSTRRMDLLGGLARPMPLTFAIWLTGALALCAVPGLNGLPGELMLYLGLFGVVLDVSPWLALLAAVCGAGLALTGALALACFVRALGAMFLGTPRSPQAQAAHESPLAMTGAMLALAGLCVAAGLLPFALSPLLDRVIGEWSGANAPAAVATLVPWPAVSWIGAAALAGMMALTAWLMRRSPGMSAATALHLQASGPPRAATATAGAGALGTVALGTVAVGTGAIGTWDCGYIRPASPRIQYTASSFGALLVSLFGWAVAPRTAHRRSLGLFPPPGAFATRPRERVLAGLLVPFFQDLARRCARLRILQQGQIHVYLVYILFIFLLGIACAALSPWSFG